MYRGYNLDLSGAKFAQYIETGTKLHTNIKNKIENSIRNSCRSDGLIDGKKITESWFPQVDADIFLSHSHADEKLVKGLAGWLNEKFKLVTFIDSCAWGYAGQLQRLIDDRYSKKPNNTYDYEQSNRAAAHVHMMLNIALTKMINSCECVIFLNTPNSTNAEGYVTGSETTSPWIFSEITMTKLIQQRPAEEHRQTRISRAIIEGAESIKIAHPIPLDHMTKIDTHTLDNLYNSLMHQQFTPSNRHRALDKLYEITV